MCVVGNWWLVFQQAHPTHARYSLQQHYSEFVGLSYGQQQSIRRQGKVRQLHNNDQNTQHLCVYVRRTTLPFQSHAYCVCEQVKYIQETCPPTGGEADPTAGDVLDQEKACLQLWNISLSKSKVTALVKEGAIPAVIGAISKGTVPTQSACLGCLSCILQADNEALEEMVSNGIIKILYSCFATCMNEQSKNLQILDQTLILAADVIALDAALAMKIYSQYKANGFEQIYHRSDFNAVSKGALKCMSSMLQQPKLRQEVISDIPINCLFQKLNHEDVRIQRMVPQCFYRYLRNVDRESISESIKQLSEAKYLHCVCNMIGRGWPELQRDIACMLFYFSSLQVFNKLLLQYLPQIVELAEDENEECRSYAVGTIWMVSIKVDFLPQIIPKVQFLTPKILKLLTSKNNEARFNAQGAIRVLSLSDEFLENARQLGLPDYLYETLKTRDYDFELELEDEENKSFFSPEQMKLQLQ
eukprot:TRINITY_DN1526_c0_g1_i4.p1 TRINITY_DN1526_c0_g1~~TRINITY_DN1526_c0_g1_i4.p1  ORF type:complete len:472 (+),score=24.88 TRINITY_DN1526_c0_g1_i4:34-1449(+)